jgi:hypothetical protein
MSVAPTLAGKPAALPPEGAFASWGGPGPLIEMPEGVKEKC